MERESFEDEEVAEILNKYFISIKVDKEERPDIDSIYMTVCQALTGSGGWPMTILMTPERKPFYAGTYFPKKSKYGRPGLMDILKSVEEAWKNKREDLIESSQEITETIINAETLNRNIKLNDKLFKKAFEQYNGNFDSVFGGIGDEPKFPIPHNLMYLLRYSYFYGENKALKIVEKTLESMYKGGIFDHIGFGFSRYSVDRKWLVPHFEKMLYDNALLAITYTEAYQYTGKEFYKEVSEKIFTYILRDMTSKEGGFYSAEDADSEGVEGKFYVWDINEIVNLLGKEDGEFFCDYYNITGHGNFEGKNIPNLISSKISLIENNKEIKDKLEGLIKLLFEYREKRVHPHKDDKILTAWNGLMIAALAYAGRVYNNKKYICTAEKAAEFILSKLVNEDGRLLARYRDGESAFLAYLDDYAFLTWGLIELYESTLEHKFLRKAVELIKEMIELFADEEKGGLYLYAKDAEQLIIRPKEIYDGALPSGNSVAALNLIRLARLTGEDSFAERAEKIFENFAVTIDNYPAGYSMCVTALMLSILGTKEIVISGEKDSKSTLDIIKIVNEKYLPFSTVVLNDGSNEVNAISSLVSGKPMLKNKTTIYICEHFTCGVPITSVEELKKL